MCQQKGRHETREKAQILLRDRQVFQQNFIRKQQGEEIYQQTACIWAYCRFKVAGYRTDQNQLNSEMSMYKENEVSDKDFLFQEPKLLKQSCVQNSHCEEMRYEAEKAENNPVMWDLVCHADEF